LAALIQLNTGMRISEPVLARLDDLGSVGYTLEQKFTS
jgi:hypothetical protein